MGGTLFFVHGTGVRDEGYKVSLALIKAGMERNSVGIDDARGISWGSELGVKVDRLSDVLPDVSTKAAEFEPSPGEIAASVWQQLIEDPLFELRIAAVRPPVVSTAAGLPGQEFPTEKVVAKLKSVALKPEDLKGTGIGEAEVKQAADRLSSAPELAGAARSFGNANDPDFNLAMARSLIASIIAEHRYDPPGTAPALAYDGAIRDRLVGTIEGQLNPTPTKGFIKDWLKTKAEEIAKARATTVLREHRTGLTGVSLPGVGDILFYQRRGSEILDRISAEIAACPPPVLAIGHSLGGIMLVDLLSRPAAPAVKLLVTVGSQSPLFYIIDSLATLRPGPGPGPAPKPFVPWLNIYDPNDFLSFRAQVAFAGQAGIKDRMVTSNVPFPESHSAYWHQDEVFRLIKTEWVA